MKYARMLLELRKALGNRVFEDNVDDDNTDDVEGEGDDMEGGAGGGCASCLLRLEDARDRVVDMIVDVERRGKRGVVSNIPNTTSGLTIVLL